MGQSSTRGGRAAPLPQEFRPAIQNIQETLIRADQPRIEQSPTSSPIDHGQAETAVSKMYLNRDGI
jgi:hypothetical protein